MSAFLLLLAILTSAGRLSITDWTSGLELPTELAGLGVLLGIALGASRFRPRLVNLLALGYSLLVVPWLMGLILYPYYIAWDEKLLSMGGRLVESLDLLFRQQPLEDTFLFVFLVSIAYWILGLVAGYSLFRKQNYLAAMLPAGLAMVFVQLYDPTRARVGMLGFYLFLALLLLGRLSYLEKHTYWKDQHAPLSAEVSTDLNLSILITSTILVLAAWVIPTPANPIKATRKLWWEVNQAFNPARESLGNMVAGLQSTRGSAIEPTGYNLYGETLAFGQKAATGNNLLFLVYAPSGVNIPRYYWRVRSYDLYEAGEWSSSPLGSLDFTPEGENLPLPTNPLPLLEEFTFVIKQENIITFATPSHPAWISRPAKVQYVRAGEDFLEPVLFSSTTYLGAGDRYRVRAFIRNPYISQLDAAGTDYPAWITDRYLQLPYDLSPRIVELARQVSAGAETPYDQVMAITDYLRQAIVYRKSVDPIPEETDPLEWLLFESREGFCNYYASAEVIMLRAVGIPSRLVVGFSQGEWEAGTANARRITRENAHAWPEAYFPGIGWVEFEPTAGEPPLLRPLEPPPDSESPSISTTPGPQELPDNLEPPAELEPGLQDGEVPLEEDLAARRSSGWAIAITLLTLSVFTGGILLWRRQISRSPVTTPLPVRLKVRLEERSINVPRWLVRWADFAMQPPVQRAFGIVFRSLYRLTGEARPSNTPAEVATALKAQLPQASEAIEVLLKEYQAWLYSPEPGRVEVARAASHTVRRMAWREWLRRNARAILVKFSPRSEKQ